MRRQMIEDAAFEVATQVRAVEDCIDTTLTEIAELQARLMHANSVARVGPAPIHAALSEVSGALASLINARGAIVACHGELVTAKSKVPGLRTVAFGDEECPPAKGQVTLRAVA